MEGELIYINPINKRCGVDLNNQVEIGLDLVPGLTVRPVGLVSLAKLGS